MSCVAALSLHSHAMLSWKNLNKSRAISSLFFTSLASSLLHWSPQRERQTIYMTMMMSGFARCPFIHSPPSQTWSLKRDRQSPRSQKRTITRSSRLVFQTQRDHSPEFQSFQSPEFQSQTPKGPPCMNRCPNSCRGSSRSAEGIRRVPVADVQGLIHVPVEDDERSNANQVLLKILLKTLLFPDHFKMLSKLFSPFLCFSQTIVQC